SAGRCVGSRPTSERLVYGPTSLMCAVSAPDAGRSSSRKQTFLSAPSVPNVLAPILGTENPTPGTGVWRFGTARARPGTQGTRGTPMPQHSLAWTTRLDGGADPTGRSSGGWPKG